MIFGFPFAFLGLSAVIPILLLHLRRARRRTVEVSSLRLWQFYSYSSESVKRKRIRESIHLILQLLAVIFLVLASSDPMILEKGRGSGRVVIILDGSASMAAEENRRTRFDLAKEEAEKIIGRAGTEGAAIILAAGEPRIIAGFSDTPREAAAAVRGAEVSEKAGAMDSAFETAELLAAGKSCEIIIISDGCFTSDYDFTDLPEFVPIGGERPGNTGITALSARADPAAANRHQIFTSILNASDGPSEKILELRLDGLPVETRKIMILPEERSEQFFTVDAESGMVEISVHDSGDYKQDGFPLDDSASLEIGNTGRASVLLVTGGNYYLTTLLELIPGVELSVADRLPPGVFDAVIFDTPPVENLPRGNYIFLGAPPAGFPVNSSGRIADFPSVRRWDSEHPVMKGVDPGGFTVYRSEITEAAAGSPVVPVLESEAPLIYAYDDKIVRSVYLTFPLAASNLHIRPAFPVLITNSLKWLCPGLKDDAYSISSDHINILSEEESDLRRRFDTEGAFAERAIYGEDEDASAAAFRRIWPYLLLAALIILMGERFLARRNLPGSGRRGRGELLITAAAVVLLAAAAFNPRAPLGRTRLSVVYLLDTSKSILPAVREAGMDWIRETSGSAGGADESSLIAFGKDSVTSSPPAPRLLNDDIEILPDGDGTNAEKAVRRALTLLPPDGDRRIILLSDGNETDGDLHEFLGKVGGEGLRIDCLPLVNEASSNELMINSITGPEEVSPNEKFRLTVEIKSLFASEGKLVFYVDGEYFGEDDLDVKEGSSQYVYSLSLRRPGYHIIEAVLESDYDYFSRNNRYQKIISAKGNYPILYIHGDERPSGSIMSLLGAQGWETDVLGAGDFPETLARLLSYEAVILDNVSSLSLTYSEMELLRRAVSAGTGVLASGGDSSFGLGGYYKTPLESFLPVDVDIASSMELPETVILMLIDKSGTMRESAGTDDDGRARLKIDLARQAVISAAEVLEESHQAAILSFDAEWEWITPFLGAGELETIKQYMNKLAPGGGTLLYPALEEALRALSEHPAAVKHLLILSDGYTDQRDFESIAADFRAEGITISTVAVGENSDRTLMENLARWGQGRFYFAADIQSVPAIFAEESLKASRKLTVEETFFPAAVSNHPVLDGIDTAMIPPLNGFLLTYLKPEAEVLLEGTGGNPLLAVKQYGLGRTAAFTSSLDSPWTEEWGGWEDYPRLFSQLIRWIAADHPGSGITFSVMRDGDRGLVRADASTGDAFLNGLNLGAQIITPGLDEQIIRLGQTAPGRYEGSFSAENAGNYFVTLIDPEEEKAGAESRVLTVPYADEFRKIRHSESYLEKAAEITGGSLLSLDEIPGQDYFTPDPALPKSPLELKSGIINSALLLYLLALVLRLLPQGSVKRLYLRLRSGNREKYEKILKTIEQEKRNEEQKNRSDEFWFGR